MPFIFVNILNPAAAAGTRRLGTVEETPQKVRQNDKHQGVEQQTAQLGNTFACGDPAAEQGTSQFEGLGAGDSNERGKGDELLDGIHLIRVKENIYVRLFPLFTASLFSIAAVIFGLLENLEFAFTLFILSLPFIFKLPP